MLRAKRSVLPGPLPPDRLRLISAAWSMAEAQESCDLADPACRPLDGRRHPLLLRHGGQRPRALGRARPFPDPLLPQHPRCAGARPRRGPPGPGPAALAAVGLARDPAQRAFRRPGRLGLQPGAAAAGAGLRHRVHLARLGLDPGRAAAGRALQPRAVPGPASPGSPASSSSSGRGWMRCRRQRWSCWPRRPASASSTC